MRQTTTNLRDFIDSYENGKIIPYDKNRGRGKLNNESVRGIADNFNFQSLGLLTIEDIGNGRFLMRDFHHRAAAIMLRHKNGLFTKQDYKQNITTHIVPNGEGLRVYGQVNSGIPHTTQNKLSNSDLLFANILNKTLELANANKGFAGRKEFPNKFKLQVANSLYAVKNLSSLTYKTIFYARNSVKPLLNVPNDQKAPENIRFANTEVASVAEAVSFADEVYNRFIDKYPVSKKDKPQLDGTAKDLLTCSTFFGYILSERLRGEKSLLRNLSARVWASRMFKRNSDILKHARVMNIELENSAAEITKILLGRQGN